MSYRIFGSQMSPYSVKVRSYFRYKAIPHQWVARSVSNDDEYRQFAKLPIVPTVVTPSGEGMQDSTLIVEAIEALHPTPSIHPEDGVLAFLSALIEEFGDEWGNKLMFHHRWYAEIDSRTSAQSLARLMRPEGTEEDVAAVAAKVLKRMTGRGHFVGSSDATAPLIRQYYEELLELVEAHMAGRKYLFGARPAFGDFGLFAQLYEASIDPTAGSIIRARSENTLDWCYRMLDPRDDGPFENWQCLMPTLVPILAYIGRYFLPWSKANADALAAGTAEFSVDLAGQTYVQLPQKYHAKSLAVLKAKYAAVADNAELREVLADAGCLDVLAPT